MAHFAKLSETNIVLSVEVVDNAILLDENNVEQENLGIQFLNQIHGWPYWKQTSYNTRHGKHYSIDQEGNRILSTDQSKAFRKNYAGIGMTYDSNRDAFITEKPFNSWTLNENTCDWECPVAFPSTEEVLVNEVNQAIYVYWDEENARWSAEDTSTPINYFRWDTDSLSWVQT